MEEEDYTLRSQCFLEVGRKEEWEEKPQGMTFTCMGRDNHPCEKKAELEGMEEETISSVEKAIRMMEQAINFMQEIFMSLRVCKILT